jgi:hypothetical protein
MTTPAHVSLAADESQTLYGTWQRDQHPPEIGDAQVFSVCVVKPLAAPSSIFAASRWRVR